MIIKNPDDRISWDELFRVRLRSEDVDRVGRDIERARGVRLLAEEACFRKWEEEDRKGEYLGRDEYLLDLCKGVTSVGLLSLSLFTLQNLITLFDNKITSSNQTLPEDCLFYTSNLTSLKTIESKYSELFQYRYMQVDKSIEDMPLQSTKDSTFKQTMKDALNALLDSNEENLNPYPILKAIAPILLKYASRTLSTILSQSQQCRSPILSQAYADTIHYTGWLYYFLTPSTPTLVGQSLLSAMSSGEIGMCEGWTVMAQKEW